MMSELMVIENERSLNVGRPMDRDLIVEFADTLMGIHPGAKDVGIVGMRSVAQLALFTGANPLPGTNGIHAWKDKRGNICIQFGVGFWRTQAELEGGRLWIFRPRPMDEQERDFYGITKEQTASICAGALKRDVFGLLREGRELGIELSLKEAKQEFGCTGIGIVNPGEYDAAGKNKQWKADLRAERDMLRQLVPVMQRARQNAISGARVNGGEGWSASNFAHVGSVPGLADGYSADDANGELLEDWDPVVFESGTDEDGDIIDVTPEPKIIETHPDSMVAELEAVTGDVAPLPDDEQVIYETSQADYFKAVIALIPRYDNVFAVKNALKKLGYTGVSTVPMKRVEMYRDLRQHAQERDAEEAGAVDVEQVDWLDEPQPANAGAYAE